MSVSGVLLIFPFMPLAFIFLDGLKQKEEAASEDTPVVTEGDATEPTAEAEVAAE